MKKTIIWASLIVIAFILLVGTFDTCAAEKAKNGIPVLYFKIDESQGTIEEMNKSPKHTAECHGSVDIVIPKGYKGEYADKLKDIKGLELDYIRGRGTSTWQIPDKKPYKIKLKDSTDLFGMGKNKHWVLLANAMDPTFLRNKITYWLGDAVGLEYTMKSVPVEVYMNGEYYGLYFLCEHVRIGETRVDIDELDENVNSGAELTGGYLISMDPYDIDGNDNGFCTTRDVAFQFESPDFLEYQNDAQKKYISDYLQDTENSIFGSGFQDENGKRYTEYMDIDSAVNFWWVQQISRNQDAYFTDSTLLYKKRNGKLYWGPIWDFDVTTWGDASNVMSDIEGFGPSMIWLDRLKSDEEFASLIIERWSTFDTKLDELSRDGGMIDQYYNEIKKAAESDRKKWKNYGYMGSYAEEIYNLKEWIKVRREWIGNNLEKSDDYVTFYTDQWVDGVWYNCDGVNTYAPRGQWKTNDTGWWYEDESGWYPTNCWMKIDYTWYYFDENGYMAQDEWRDGCYLGTYGMYEDYNKGTWKNTTKGWRFEDESGWHPSNISIKIDGIWYFFDSAGYWVG